MRSVSRTWKFIYEFVAVGIFQFTTSSAYKCFVRSSNTHYNGLGREFRNAKRFKLVAWNRETFLVVCSKSEANFVYAFEINDEWRF